MAMVMSFNYFVLGAIVFIVGTMIVVFNLKMEMKYQKIPYPKTRNPKIIGRLMIAGFIMMIGGVAAMGIAGLI